jgi:predicted  nucleic acid-binding Zn-ribbon protein
MLEECCEDRGRQVTALREQLVEMTKSRDNFERLCKEWRIEFDALNAKKDDLQTVNNQLEAWIQMVEDLKRGVSQLQQELVNARGLTDVLEQENAELEDERNAALTERNAARTVYAVARTVYAVALTERNAALAQVAIVIAERDAAELERTESRAEVVQLRAVIEAHKLTCSRCRLWQPELMASGYCEGCLWESIEEQKSE